MNYLNKYCLIFLIFNLILIKSFAQDNAINLKFPPSPNASNLGIYGKTNVNLYTGTPNINIPLYTITERSINVPISLDYNASGVHPNIKTSWVGMNWNLNCGGVITREVKGSSHDEVMTTGFFAAPHMAVDVAYSNNEVVTDQYGNQTTVNPIAALAAAYDLEPDIFYFNFCGYTGKFFRNNNSSTQFGEKHFEVVPNQNFSIDVESGIDIGQEYIYQIVIKDANGIKYTFGTLGDPPNQNENAEAVEFSKTEPPYDYSGDPNHLFIPTAWYLKEIKSPSGDIITFYYSHRDPTNHRYVSWSSNAYYRMEHSAASTVVNMDPFGWFTSTLTYNCSNIVNRSFDSFTTCNYLDSIETTNETLIFYRTSTSFALYTNTGSLSYENQYDQRLNQIVVKDNFTRTTIKSINLYYNENNTGNRLRLDRLQFYDPNGNSLQPYRFNYKNFNVLPATCTDKIDAWGFFNNRSGIMPSYINGVIGNERTANPDVCDAGMLEYVYYPTGGYSHYEYEINDVDSIVTRVPNGFTTNAITNGNVGGVRIARITDNDGIKSSYRTYSYTGGILFQVPVWGLTPAGNVFPQDNQFNTVLSSNEMYTELWSSTSVFSLPDDYVGYSSVSVNYSDGSKEIQTFTNWADFKDETAQLSSSSMISLYFPIISRSLSRGKIKSILYKDGSNNPVKSVEYNYNRNLSSRDYQFLQKSVFAIKNNYSIYQTNSNIINLSTPYWIFYYPMYIQREVEKDYNVPYDGTYVSKEKRYGYNPYNQIVADTTTNSAGLQDVILTKFTTNYYNCGGNDLSDAYSSMLYEYNMVDNVIEKIHKVNNNVVSAWYNFYSDYGTFGSGDVPAVSNQYELNLSNPVSSFTGLNTCGLLVSGTNYSLNQSLTYDSKFNISGIQKVNNINSAYLWAYNNSYLVVKAEGVSYATLSSAVSSIQSNFDNFLKNSVGNLSTTTQKNNWKSFNTSLRSYSSLQSVPVTTYTFKPLVGITSETTPNGTTTYYIYDSFGRLSELRDDDGKLLKKYTYNYATN